MTKPSALLNITVAFLSEKEMVILPRTSPLGLPSAATEAYRSISIGKGTDPVMMSLEKSLGATNPSPGHTQVHLSSGFGLISDLSQTGLPDAHNGHSHEPQANKSKFPFVHPMI